jgi:hypothetical protein
MTRNLKMSLKNLLFRLPVLSSHTSFASQRHPYFLQSVSEHITAVLSSQMAETQNRGLTDNETRGLFYSAWNYPLHCPRLLVVYKVIDSFERRRLQLFFARNLISAVKSAGLRPALFPEFRIWNRSLFLNSYK